MGRTQQAHDDQVVVWQAEGVLMEVFRCDAPAARVVLRLQARAESRSVTEVAVDLLAGRREWLPDHI